MEAEFKGTQAALTKAGRPNGLIKIPAICPESMGALMQFFFIATTYMAALLKVDAFNQPGVEESKKTTRLLLGLEK